VLKRMRHRRACSAQHGLDKAAGRANSLSTVRQLLKQYLSI
jgi:hypothetical protein